MLHIKCDGSFPHCFCKVHPFLGGRRRGLLVRRDFLRTEVHGPAASIMRYNLISTDAPYRPESVANVHCRKFARQSGKAVRGGVHQVAGAGGMGLLVEPTRGTNRECYRGVPLDPPYAAAGG